MQSSTTLTELPKALAAFQAEHHAAGRDSKGNYGTYTSLAGALAAVKNACKEGLSHSQTLHPLGEDVVVLRTTLFHASGEYILSDLPIPLKAEGGRGNYWQSLGSALTYARRYTLLAIYGLAGDDDDAETSDQPAPAAKPAAPAKPSPAAKPATPAQAVQHVTAPPKQIVWIDDERRKVIVAALRAHEQKDEFLAAFKAQFKIATPRVGPEQIQLPEHGDFLEALLQPADAA
jgi:hypothetical protein